MKQLHLIVGLVAVVTFLRTGVFMRLHQPSLGEMDGGTRMLYRSRHVYLLLAGLLNLALGTYCRASERTWRRRLQSIGSCLILAAPPLLLAAFVRGPHGPDPAQPFTSPAIIGLLAGTLLHAVGGGRSEAAGGVTLFYDPKIPGRRIVEDDERYRSSAGFRSLTE
jgi:hypothetical protein